MRTTKTVCPEKLSLKRFINVLFFNALGLNRELAKVTRRADQVDQLEEQINTLQNQYTATEQKYQTMLTVCHIFKIFRSVNFIPITSMKHFLYMLTCSYFKL